MINDSVSKHLARQVSVVSRSLEQPGERRERERERERERIHTARR